MQRKIHQAVEQVTSAAKPDPWLAQKIRVRAQEKEEKHMKKKLPAGAVIVIAIMLLMTAVAAAVTNGFGLLRFFPEQAENTAFTERIVTIGQTWEGKYFSAEIKEAVFDGAKLRFNMSVTPKEGAGQIFVKPVVKAVINGRKSETTINMIDSFCYDTGIWIPYINPPEIMEPYDLNDMAFEVSLTDNDMLPTTTDKDVEWTLTFYVMKTDWKIIFSKYPGDNMACETEEDWAWLEKETHKLINDAHARHELVLDQYGSCLDLNIQEPFLVNGALYDDRDEDEIMLDLYTREVFTLEEQAVFSFVADRAEIHEAQELVSFVLPEKQEYQVERAAATADEIKLVVTTRYTHIDDFFDYDNMPWSFVLKSDQMEFLTDNYSLHQSLCDQVLDVSYVFDHSITKPVHTVVLVPVQGTDDGPVEREDLAVTINLE